MAPSADFIAAFRAAAGPDGAMTFARFMDLALYDPALGYYRRNLRRVGRAPGTDFVTASSAGALFGELIAGAAAALLTAQGGDPRDYVFVEIGAEDAGVLASTRHSFGSSRSVQLGRPLELAGRCVVFSNELFDAQPFRRLVRRGGAWREIGVAWRAPELIEVELQAEPELGGPLAALDGGRPSWPEGYVIDAPLGALALAASIVQSEWSGLFLAFDYGKSWRELVEETPAGTARAYHRHRQSNDLLARPGEQDLTCHICWDWLSAALGQAGFHDPLLESQEAFFVRHAGKLLEPLVSSNRPETKSALRQLLHPGNFGQKFQVLHASRG
jgi:SAM-dependent MidA family methyltransferase